MPAQQGEGLLEAADIIFADGGPRILRNTEIENVHEIGVLAARREAEVQPRRAAMMSSRLSFAGRRGLTSNQSTAGTAPRPRPDPDRGA